MQLKSYFYLLISPLFFLLLISCTGPEDPEVAIARYISTAEKHFEEKNTNRLKKMIAEDYSDSKGFSRQEIVRIIAGYFLRHQSVYVLTNTRDISLADNQSTAHVTLYAAISREPLLETDLELVQAERYRLEAKLQNVKGDWRLTSADLEEISASEFVDSYD